MQQFRVGDRVSKVGKFIHAKTLMGRDVGFVKPPEVGFIRNGGNHGNS